MTAPGRNRVKLKLSIYISVVVTWSPEILSDQNVHASTQDKAVKALTKYEHPTKMQPFSLFIFGRLYFVRALVYHMTLFE